MQSVIIHSPPRSGSTWLGQIFNSSPNTTYFYQPLFSYLFKNRLDEDSSLEQIQLFFQDLNNSQDDYINQVSLLKKYPELNFSKGKTSHIVYKEVRYHYLLKNLIAHNIKLICLIRNPLATINSWLKAPREFRSDLGWQIAAEWRFAVKKNGNKKEEYNGYEKWKECVYLFESLKKESPANIFLLQYKDLIANPIEITQQLFQFCNLPYSEQTTTFINLSCSKNYLDSYAVFKKKKDDFAWEKELPLFIIDEIHKDLKNNYILKKYL